MMDERKEMVKRLSEGGYIKSENVRKAMEEVPREEFIPESNKPYAYVDRPLPIGEGQTISAPHMVAMICEILELEEGMNVLEIGTGFGYNAAVVAKILGEKGHLYSIERIESLAKIAKDNLKRIGLEDNLTVIVGDGTKGYPEKAPYDRIYGTASAPSVPEPLKEQLKVGGIMLVPVGEQHYFQDLIYIKRESEDEYSKRSISGVAFVPMIGEHGWPE
ncbi:protein-L-isoaspartate O-methyltransferase [Methanobacterium sp. ACI-7]|uniref:protein-L-isoaspartate O-methyltransferase n=1 Tax=unclassified Methanobacterium TaxID=2627676 RepID=UPI0039C37C56